MLFKKLDEKTKVKTYNHLLINKSKELEENKSTKVTFKKLINKESENKSIILKAWHNQIAEQVPSFYSFDELVEAFEINKGIIKSTAEMLHVSYDSLCKKIHKSKELKEVLRNIVAKNSSKLSGDAVRTLLVEHDGKLGMAAKKVGCSYQVLLNRIMEDDDLREFYQTMREIKLDEAEKDIEKASKEGTVAATMFILRCQGKKRGWSEKQKDGEGDMPVTINITPFGNVSTTVSANANNKEVSISIDSKNPIADSIPKLKAEDALFSDDDKKDKGDSKEISSEDDNEDSEEISIPNEVFIEENFSKDPNFKDPKKRTAKKAEYRRIGEVMEKNGKKSGKNKYTWGGKKRKRIVAKKEKVKTIKQSMLFEPEKY